MLLLLAEIGAAEGTIVSYRAPVIVLMYLLAQKYVVAY